MNETSVVLPESQRPEEERREDEAFERALLERERERADERADAHADVVHLGTLEVGARFRLAGMPYITGRVLTTSTGSVGVFYDTVFVRYQKGPVGRETWRVRMWRAAYQINIAPGTMVLPARVRDRIWGGVAQAEGFPLFRSAWDLSQDIERHGGDVVSRLWGGPALGAARKTLSDVEAPATPEEQIRHDAEEMAARAVEDLRV